MGLRVEQQHVNYIGIAHGGIGSGGGIRALLDGAIDIAIVSRRLTADEREQGLVYTPFSRIPVVVAAGHQSTVDLTRPGGLTVVDDTGFAICDLLPGGLSVAFQPLDPPAVLKHVPEERLRGRG